jgi:hypothetical protein
MTVLVILEMTSFIVSIGFISRLDKSLQDETFVHLDCVILLKKVLEFRLVKLIGFLIVPVHHG